MNRLAASEMHASQGAGAVANRGNLEISDFWVNKYLTWRSAVCHAFRLWAADAESV